MEAVSQLQRMQAEGGLLTQCSECLLSAEMTDRKKLSINELGLEIETLLEQFLLGLQPLAAARQMGQFQATSELHIAVDFPDIDNRARQFNCRKALRKKCSCTIQAPVFNPLAVIEASECGSDKAAVSTAATPAAPVRLEDHRFCTEVAGDVISGAQAGIATADDSDIGFMVAV